MAWKGLVSTQQRKTKPMNTAIPDGHITSNFFVGDVIESWVEPSVEFTTLFPLTLPHIKKKKKKQILDFPQDSLSTKLRS